MEWIGRWFVDADTTMTTMSVIAFVGGAAGFKFVMVAVILSH